MRSRRRVLIRRASGERGLVGAGGLERLECGGAIFLFFEFLDFEFGVLQAGFADFEELGAFFVFAEQFGEGNLALFHRVNDGFQAIEGAFEAEFGVFIRFHRVTVRPESLISNNLSKGLIYHGLRLARR